MKEVQGSSDTGDPWVCPACRSRIKANPEGTRVVRTEVTPYVLMPDGTASTVAGAKAQVSYYHTPCWRAAVNHFNEECRKTFHT